LKSLDLNNESIEIKESKVIKRNVKIEKYQQLYNYIKNLNVSKGSIPLSIIPCSSCITGSTIFIISYLVYKKFVTFKSNGRACVESLLRYPLSKKGMIYYYKNNMYTFKRYQKVVPWPVIQTLPILCMPYSAKF